MWLISQSQGLVPTEYAELSDPLAWAGLLLFAVIAVAVLIYKALPRLIEWRVGRHMRQADALDAIEITRVEHTETSAVRMEAKLDAKDERLLSLLERELAEEKKRSERYLNELLAQRAAVGLTTSPDPLDQERGRKVVAALDLELADEPGLSRSAIRRIEEQSEAHISDATDDDDKKGAWSWPMKKKST